MQRLVFPKFEVREAITSEKWAGIRARRRVRINFQKQLNSIPWGWKRDLDEECWAEERCLIVKAVFKKPWAAEGWTTSFSYRSETAQLHVPQPLLPELPARPMSGLMEWLNRFRGECHPIGGSALQGPSVVVSTESLFLLSFHLVQGNSLQIDRRRHIRSQSH